VQHHHEVGEPQQQGGRVEAEAGERGRRAGSLRRHGGQAPRSILAFIESPTRRGCLASSRGFSAMRTGTRCTTLIQLPVAFWAGITAKAEPVPPEKPWTRPWNFTPSP